MNHAFTIVAAMLAWMALTGAIRPAAAETSEEAVRAVLLKTWDKPDAKLVVDPVVVVGDHAIAGWTQGVRGGRALLKLRSGSWSVVLCSGDPLKQASALVEAGVLEENARRLVRDLSAAERRADPARVRLFATFEGVVRMHDTKIEDHSATMQTPSH